MLVCLVLLSAVAYAGKMNRILVALALLAGVTAWAPATRGPIARTRTAPLRAISTEDMIEKAKTDRLAHLESQALEALTLAAENFEKAVFPNAMIVGDCVITHLLGKLGYLESGKVRSPAARSSACLAICLLVRFSSDPFHSQTCSDVLSR